MIHTHACLRRLFCVLCTHLATTLPWCRIDTIACFNFGEAGSPPSFSTNLPVSMMEMLSYEAKVSTLRDKEKRLPLSPSGPDAKVYTKAKSAIPSTPVVEISNDSAVARKRDAGSKENVAAITPNRRLQEATSVNASFLAAKAAKSKSAMKARRRRDVGLNERRSKAVKLSHNGTGVPLDCVVKFKHHKGHTQAVKIVGRMSDFLQS